MVKIHLHLYSSDTIDPDKEGDVAKLKGALWEDWLGVVRAEERTCFLRGLVVAGVGTNDVENFIAKQESIRFRRDNVRGKGNDRDNVVGLMQCKLDDSIWDADRRRDMRNKLRARLERLLQNKKSMYKRFIHKMRDKVVNERDMLKKTHSRKFREIRLKRSEQKQFTLPDGLERYKNAKIFSDEHAGEFVTGEVLGPVIVGGNTTLLSGDEVAALSRGPKFTIRRILSRERFLVELEKSFVKIRWSKRDEDDDEEESMDNEMELDPVEQARISEIAEMEEAKTRMIFDHENMEIDW